MTDSMTRQGLRRKRGASEDEDGDGQGAEEVEEVEDAGKAGEVEKPEESEESSAQNDRELRGASAAAAGSSASASGPEKERHRPPSPQLPAIPASKRRRRNAIAPNSKDAKLVGLVADLHHLQKSADAQGQLQESAMNGVVEFDGASAGEFSFSLLCKRVGKGTADAGLLERRQRGSVCAGAEGFVNMSGGVLHGQTLTLTQTQTQ